MNKTFTLSVNEIDESVNTLSEALREIASLIEQGYTSGYEPMWKLTEEKQ